MPSFGIFQPGRKKHLPPVNDAAAQPTGDTRRGLQLRAMASPASTAEGFGRDVAEFPRRQLFGRIRLAVQDFDAVGAEQVQR